MAYPGTTVPGGNIALKVVGEDANTLTLGWDTPSTAGYRFDSPVRRSHTWDTSRRTVRFAKGSAWYRVTALDASAVGEFKP